MKKQKIIIWSTSVSDLLDGKAYGIAVQLYFWAQTFVRHGWQVTSFTHHKSFVKEGVNFKRVIRWGKLEIIHEWLSVFLNLLILYPRIVIYRGADRVVLPLAVISKWLGVKFVLFGASDSDYQPGQELLAGSPINRKMFQKALRKTTHFVTQNKVQHDDLLQNYGKESLVLPNIWSVKSSENFEKKYDAIWVANLRPLKRAEWFVRLANSLPQYHFAIVGGISKKDYYDKIEKEASIIDNLSFLGAKSFEEVNVLIGESRLLICTSEFEGFPNTFLQAWAFSVPVISTVNPNDVITKYGLGRIVNNEEDLLRTMKEIQLSVDIYKQSQHSIKNYFLTHHDADAAYQKIQELTKK